MSACTGMIEMSCATKKLNTRSGGALLLVLGFILLATWLVVQFMARVKSEMTLRANPHQTHLARSVAFQALEVTVAVLQEIRLLDGELYNPVQGWGDPMGYAGISPYAEDDPDTRFRPVAHDAGLNEVAFFRIPDGFEVDVVIRDESGLLPLNHTSEERWKHFFEAMEISSSDINVLTDSLLDWIDSDNTPRLHGAEAETYLLRDPPYRPANAPIDHLHEIKLIQGFDRLFFDEHGVPNELFRTFSENVSTWSEGPINFNSAPLLVLEALAEDLEFEVQRVIDYLSGPDGEQGTADDRILRPDLDSEDLPRDNKGDPLDFSAISRYLTVHIEVQSAGITFRLAARIDTASSDPDDIYPIQILDLQTRGADL